MGAPLKNYKYADLIEHLAREVTRLTGVQLGESQLQMVRVRLGKRVQDLGYRNLFEYQGYYEEHETSEIQHIISLLTTHYTYFFREFSHFEFLAVKALPALVAEVRSRPDKTLKIWCAAASRGQEVYSLAMYLHFHLKAFGPDLKFKILGTDVDEQSIRIAENGVYPRREISEVPLSYLGNHWARGTGEVAEFVKARSSLREVVSFEKSNLLDLQDRFVGQMFDIIFCRNVFIYFTPEQIRTSTSMLLRHLNPKGYFFIGISESLNGLGFDLKMEGPSIYRFTGQAPATAASSTGSSTAPRATIPAERPVRVFCIDDSPSIHTLMKHILRKESGFEVVGTALNGIEAASKLKGLNGQVDVVTLDIHMPEQNGVEYLEKNFGPDHPPVVVVSSVSRDQSEVAMRTLELGASDFVEKPALNKLEERGEEIRAKLKTAIGSRKGGSVRSLTLDSQFKKTLLVRNPERKARVQLTGLGHLAKTAAMIREFGPAEPPVYLLFEGVEANLPAVAEELSKKSGKTVRYQEALVAKAKPGEILVLDFRRMMEFLPKLHAGDKVVFGVFGEVGAGSAGLIKAWPVGRLFLEDLGDGTGTKPLQARANEVFPYTSFAYMGTEFFGRE